MKPVTRSVLAAGLFTALITGQPAYAEETEVADEFITCENREQHTLSNFGGKPRVSKKLFDQDTPVQVFLAFKGGTVSYCEHWQDVRERLQPSQKTFTTSTVGGGCDVDTREGFHDRRIVSSSPLQVVIEPQIWESESMATVTYATYYPNEDKLIVVKQANTTPVGLSKSYFQTSDTQIFTCD